jgi:hypothetical protein
MAEVVPVASVRSGPLELPRFQAPDRFSLNVRQAVRETRRS